MNYISTRNKNNFYSFEDGLYEGLSSDGGLLLPERIPDILINDLENMHGSSYIDVAASIIKLYWEDIDELLLRQLLYKSYASFTNKHIVPVKKLGEFYIAELFHGPTLAFKDLAMQFLGNVLEYMNIKENKYINILGATSGDTGSAAIYSVKGKPHCSVFILYPHNRISEIQELQMVVHSDKNVNALAIEGSFDDCQYIVKSIFMDSDFKKLFNLVAVNSINWVRILSQIVYYFYIYLFVVKKNEIGKPLNFVVPTGNFGNVFAGYLAKKMGLPIDKLIIATNENDILKVFITKGTYKVKNVRETYSPSMDITVASNFERYLYYLLDKNDKKVVRLMSELNSRSEINIDESLLRKVQVDYLSESTTNVETIDTITKIFKEYHYIIDPHTACGVNAYYKLSQFCKSDTVCLATAHYAKFPEVVEKAIGQKIVLSESISKLINKEKHFTVLPNDVSTVKNYLSREAIK
jgi:threonine synthase